MSVQESLQRVSKETKEKILFLSCGDRKKQANSKPPLTEARGSFQVVNYSSAEFGIELLIKFLSLLLTNKKPESESFEDSQSNASTKKRKRKHCHHCINRTSSRSFLKQPKLDSPNLSKSGKSPEELPLHFFEGRKHSSKVESLYQHSTALSSANVNENNDNTSPFVASNSRSRDLSTPKSSQQKRFSKLDSQHNKLSFKSSRTSYNTNPHRQSESPTFSLYEHTQGALEKLAKESSNKRRFCESIPCWFEATQSRDSASFGKDYSPKNQFLAESLISPPRRIPRLLRRSQSAFCQARDLAEAEQIGSRPSGSCYRRFNSCTAATDSSPVPSLDISELTDFQFFADNNTPPRVPSAPVNLNQAASNKNQLKLNCNTNAAPRQRKSYKIKTVNSFHNFDLNKKDKGLLPSLSDKSLLAVQRLQLAESTNQFRDSDDCVPEPNLFLSASSSINSSAGIHSVAHKLTKGPNHFPKVSSQEVLQSQQSKPNNTKSAVLTNSETAAAEFNLCRKRQQKSGNRLFGKIRENYQLDQDIAESVHCLCRISTTENKCKHCEVRVGAEEPTFGNVSFKGKSAKDIIKTIESKTSEKHNHSLDSRINYFLQKSTSVRKPKDFATSSVNPRREDFFHSSSSSRHCQSENKHFYQSSANNHNIREETPFCRAPSHDKEVDCFRALRLGVGEFHLLNLGSALDIKPKSQFSSNAPSDRRRNLGIFSPDHFDMGCIHSVSHKKRVEPCKNGIITDVRATIDQSPTYIEEQSPIVLRYRTPYFRAHAQVIMPPIRNKETWTVGWIQACDYMRFINQYGDLGCSSWEIPALKSGKITAVSDSDGVSYPWYGNTTEIATIVGPTDGYRRMNLTMNDNFYPSVTWDIPVSEGTNAHLTRIVRDQSFITWLAAVNETTKDIFVLKTVRWNFFLEIEIDPTQELGRRANIVSPQIQKQPLVTNGPCEVNQVNSSKSRRRGVATDNNSNSNYVGQIPITALVRPSANNAQTLIWRPTDSEDVIVVPAKEEHRDTNELVLFNGCSAMHGKESIVKKITKQEMIRLQQMTR